MSALPRPDLPPGPQRDLNDALHDLHHQAGWPSLRTLAKAAGCSHTTVSTVFSSPRVPAWGLVELLVEAMGGDVQEFRALWLSLGAGTAAHPPALLAGRRRELDAVRRHLRGGAGLLLLLGEAGIGKTRLLTAAENATAEVVTLHAPCLPLSTEAPLLPVADALRSAWRVDDGAWITAALEACPPFVAPELATMLPELALNAGDAPSADSDRQRLFFALSSLLATLAQARPMAVVLEDLHWADAGTLDLVEHLVGSPVVSPALVGSYRLDDLETPSSIHEWRLRMQRSSQVTALELAPLSRDETAEQMELLLSAPVAPELVERVHRRARGHPLFTEQLVSASSEGDVPALLADLLDRRIGRLDGTSWTVARALAVVDRRVDETVLAEVADLSPAELVEAMNQLRDKRLLTMSAGGVALSHPLLAEAIRRRLSRTEARDQHHRVANTLSKLDEAVPAEVAEHWQRAGDPSSELHWRVAAALDAEARFALRVEWTHLRRALELWPDTTASRIGPEPGLTLFEALLRSYDAAYASEDLAGESSVVQRLLVITDATNTPRELRAEALRRAGDHLGAMRESRRAVELIGEAADIYRDLPPCAEYVEALENQAAALFAIGESQSALAAARRAVETAQRIGRRQRWRHAVAELAWYEGVVGNHESARAHMAQALDERDPDEVPFPELGIGCTLTDLLLVQHAPPEAFDRVGQPGLETIERWSLDTFGTGLLRSNLALGYLAAGLVDRAVAVLGPVPDEVTVGDRPRQFVQACLDIVQGRLEVADHRLEVLARFPGDVPGKLDGAVPGALLELWRGEPGGLCARFEAVLADVLSNETSSLAGTHLLLLARVRADIASIDGSGGTRSESAARLRHLRQQATVDPLGDQLTPEARTALRRTWEAELARLVGRDAIESWTAAATAWDAMVRPHDAGYCRWRAAQVALASGQGTVAARLLKRAARDAREHVPLSAAIAATSRGG
jgi:tetratricopeptide (TPR) repeat protein